MPVVVVSDDFKEDVELQIEKREGQKREQDVGVRT